MLKIQMKNRKINKVNKKYFKNILCLPILNANLYLKNMNIISLLETGNNIIYILIITLVLFIILYIFRTNKYHQTLKEIRKIEQNLLNQMNEIINVQEELSKKENEIKRQYMELESKKEELRISRERYRLTINASEVGIWEWDFEKNVIFIAYKVKVMLNLEQFLNITPKEFLKKVMPEDRTLLIQTYYEHINEKTDVYQVQCRIIVKKDKYTWINIRGKALFNNEGKPIRMAGSINNINKEKIAEAKLKKLAYYDELTGLPNRAFFVSKFKEALRLIKFQDDKIIVLLIDLDNFKSINDVLGHVYGDQVLQKVAKRLSSCMFDQDIIARFGGDEFIAFTNSCSTKKEMVEYANTIINAFRDTFDIVGISFTITVSIGIAISPDDDTESNNLMKYADMAMNYAKNNGKNNYGFYTEDLSKKVVRRIQIETDIRHAIEKNEFMLLYQPKFNLKNNKTTGIEALIRWEHPTKGMISPVEFIPIAEDLGVITKIDEWVAKEAIKQLKKWHNQGYKDLTVSVNLSAKQFKNSNLRKTFYTILKEADINPKYVEIEITETAALNDLHYANYILNDFRKKGIKVALDDFGTGYSSLNYLKALPINHLKIDKSFIDDILTESKGEEIIRAIITLAHAYKIKVIAEGVESKEQLDFLRKEKCDEIQGYYISKPLPPNKVEEKFGNPLLLSIK